MAMGMPAGAEGAVERRVRAEAERAAMRELGAARYAGAHAAGRSLTLDAAVATALDAPGGTGAYDAGRSVLVSAPGPNGSSTR
jgi:hypothetical protein